MVLLGACGGALLTLWAMSSPTTVAQDGKPEKASLEAIAAELEVVKGKLPDQAHAMHDVGYHFSNLWFAGNEEHWDLANFYLSETRSHLRWAVRIIPKRKDSAGKEIDLQAILQSLENSPLKQLDEAIKSKDKAKFDKAYRFTLEGCYACHKASDKPFIRPQIPREPESKMINFHADADWPK
jgi:hypothetical protein